MSMGSEIYSEVKEIVLPLPHMYIRRVRANTTVFVANRGGFKTTRGLSFYEIDVVYEMPGHTGVICGPSFEHLGDNTLNPLFNALNEFGFENGVHYVFGTKPPDTFTKPYIRVDSAKKYDHMISWHNGTNQFLVSMAKKGSANGISAQSFIFDEIKLMDESEINSIIIPTARGNEKYFQDSELFMSKFFATDKMADPAKIKWILKKRELNDARKIEIILSLQDGLDALKAEYDEAGINKRGKLKPQIHAIEVRLAKLRSNLTFYVEANHIDTQQILGKRWYMDKEQNLSSYELKVAIRNEDPDKPEDGFYPDFDINVVGYDDVKDYDPNKPLVIAADYQHAVSPITIAQLGILPGEVDMSLNYIDEVSTLAPAGLADAVQELCDRYRSHLNKTIYYVYDQTAIGRRNDAKQYDQIVKEKLISNHWYVQAVYTGLTPTHFDKYTDTKKWLKHEDPLAIRIRVNKTKCKYMVISITSAPAKMKNGKTEKDKSHEDTIKYPKLDQRETTHFSDAFDMSNHAVLKLKKVDAYLNRSAGVAFR